MKIAKSKKTNSISFFSLLAIASLLIVFSCKKSNSGDNNHTGSGSSSLAVINASPSMQEYDVYLDSTKFTQNGKIGYGGTTGTMGGVPYQFANAGTHAVRLSADGNTYVVDTSINFVNGNSYSVFAYDTANSSGKLQKLVLQDNLTAPAGDKSEVRFLNFSPNSNSLNVLLIGSDSASNMDTIRLSNIAYAGSNSLSADSLAAFTTINPGTYKILLNSNPANLNLFTHDSVTFAGGKIYTLYAKGFVGGMNGTDSLGVGTIPNN